LHPFKAKKEMIDESITSEAVGLLKSLISIPSLSREEEKAADYLQNYIEAEGMTTGRKGNNIWCLSPMFDLKKPTILLNSHIDTVKPVNGWRKDPFTPREENGKLYGLGSNDAGASVVTLLQVFLQLCRKQQSYNLIYLASCEEEVSGKGGIESVLPGLPPISFAVVGEPTEMQPAIAEKGLMVLDVTATGKAGHAARNEGDNAIYKVLDDIAWFRDYRFAKESPLLGPVKMSVTVINAGTQHNVIPDRCSFVVDVRSNELSLPKSCLLKYKSISFVKLKPVRSASTLHVSKKATRLYRKQRNWDACLSALLLSRIKL